MRARTHIVHKKRPRKASSPSKETPSTLKVRRTSRRAKTNRVPRTRAGGQWTEAAFWGFLRSGLRQLSRRWPPRKLAELAARRPYKGPNKRQKWEYKCAECGKYFMKKEIEVDHIEPCGTLRDYDDLPGFVMRLFCEIDGFQVGCKKCHGSKTKKSRLSA